MTLPYHAVLLVSFGGPEGPEDVLPFLKNVLRGKRVPESRLQEVAEHYHHFGGISPINDQNRALLRALKVELFRHGPTLPIYWGNRNWHPLLGDTISQMASDGIRRALAFVTSAYSSYSSCRQYRENLDQACARAGNQAPVIDKLRVFYNHPGFIEPMAERVESALDRLAQPERNDANILYTAHSIPKTMAQGSRYEAQLLETCCLVSERVSRQPWQLVFQSRSGPPTQPWLEPDICDALRKLHQEGKARNVVVVPVGFVSDHMEILFDLDTEARQLCKKLQLNMVRAETVGTHPKFVAMIRELILERINGDMPRRALGHSGPSHDICPADCCPYPLQSNVPSAFIAPPSG